MRLRPSWMTSSTIVRCRDVRPWLPSTIRALDDRDRSVVEGDAGEQLLDDALVELALDLGDVGLVDLVRRVRQALGEVAVVGEDEQPGGVGVEPPDVEEPLGPVGDEVAQAATPLGVAHRGDHAARLVEHEVDRGADRRQPLAVDADHGGARVDLGAEPGDDLAVDLDVRPRASAPRTCADWRRPTGRAASAAGSGRRRRARDVARRGWTGRRRGLHAISVPPSGSVPWPLCGDDGAVPAVRRAVRVPGSAGSGSAPGAGRSHLRSARPRGRPCRGGTAPARAARRAR